jgi:hypothetical protein
MDTYKCARLLVFLFAASSTGPSHSAEESTAGDAFPVLLERAPKIPGWEC